MCPSKRPSLSFDISLTSGGFFAQEMIEYGICEPMRSYVTSSEKIRRASRAAIVTPFEKPSHKQFGSLHLLYLRIAQYLQTICNFGIIKSPEYLTPKSSLSKPVPP